MDVILLAHVDVLYDRLNIRRTSRNENLHLGTVIEGDNTGGVIKSLEVSLSVDSKEKLEGDDIVVKHVIDWATALLGGMLYI